MIYYFSATGNSRHVAERLAAALNEQAQSIETAETAISLKDGELLGFVTPTYWNELPSNVRDFMKRLEVTLAKDNYVFTVATYGMAAGIIGEDARRLLKTKGIQMDAAYAVQMPDNWTPNFDLSDPVKVQAQVDAAEPQIDTLINQIKARTQGNKIPKSLPYIMHFLTEKLQYNSRQTKFLHVDAAKCIGCGLCAKKCPLQAIELQADTFESDKKIKKHPVWVKERCTMCLGCLHRCPQFAIDYDNKTQAHGQYQHSKYYKKAKEQ